MTHAQLVATMTHAELVEWQAFYHVEAIDQEKAEREKSRRRR